MAISSYFMLFFFFFLFFVIACLFVEWNDSSVKHLAHVYMYISWNERLKASHKKVNVAVDFKIGDQQLIWELNEKSDRETTSKAYAATTITTKI